MSITHVTPREMELQAEVDRLKGREAFHQTQRDLSTAAYAAMTKERDELRAKLAALEAQKPIAHVEYFSLSRNASCVDFHDGYKPLDKTKLYLAAGAKEKP